MLSNFSNTPKVIIMVIGLRGVQFGLLSYEWLTKSYDFKVGDWFLQTELENTMSCYQLLIITITISHKLKVSFEE